MTSGQEGLDAPEQRKRKASATVLIRCSRLKRFALHRYFRDLGRRALCAPSLRSGAQNSSFTDEGRLLEPVFNAG